MERKQVFSLRNLLLALIILLLVSIGILLYIQRSLSRFPDLFLGSRPTTTAANPLAVLLDTPTPTLATPPTQSPITPTRPPIDSPAGEGLKEQGAFIFSMTDGKYNHLFEFHPQYLSLTRLTNSPYDDIDPSVSPDGTKIAFSSRRNGYWDLFAIDLSTGKLARLTDTAEYEGKPSWSPDGQWVAYEAYINNNLDIYVRSVVDPANVPIQLTDDPASDYSPAWSPGGREIAFVSTRSGDEEIWLAYLDRTGSDRFVNVSRSPQSREKHPAWSPDGALLAWSSSEPGISSILVWDPKSPLARAHPLALGDLPVWSPGGSAIGAIITNPNQTSLAAYDRSDGEMIFPLTAMPGPIEGMDWKGGSTIDLLTNYSLPTGARNPTPELWKPVLSSNPQPPGHRFAVVPLNDVVAPYPYLHDEVDESFNALRQEVARSAGWDFLSNLENAYLPMTSPPTPDKVEDWLYTGRAFAINPMALSAGWMVLVKEEYSGQTYWRIYLKARFQDGSGGFPLKEQPWDINARFLGDTQTYDAGGRYARIPPGYWVDFTAIALRYGWARVPALVNWRSFYPATRFNIYLSSGALDWNSAMAELYPPEALITPTMLPSRTPTETPLPEDFGRITPTLTSAPTLTPTRRATWTPAPGLP